MSSDEWSTAIKDELDTNVDVRKLTDEEKAMIDKLVQILRFQQKLSDLFWIQIWTSWTNNVIYNWYLIKLW